MNGYANVISFILGILVTYLAAKLLELDQQSKAGKRWFLELTFAKAAAEQRITEIELLIESISNHPFREIVLRRHVVATKADRKDLDSELLYSYLNNIFNPMSEKETRLLFKKSTSVFTVLYDLDEKLSMFYEGHQKATSVAVDRYNENFLQAKRGYEALLRKLSTTPNVTEYDQATLFQITENVNKGLSHLNNYRDLSEIVFAEIKTQGFDPIFDNIKKLPLNDEILLLRYKFEDTFRSISDIKKESNYLVKALQKVNGSYKNLLPTIESSLKTFPKNF
jgi:hypothetical protein